MKIATSAYAPEWHDDWASLTAKIEDWVAEAAGQGADMLVFPEYAGMEAVLIGSAPESGWRVTDWVTAAADRWADWVDLHLRAAKQHGVHILAGSLPHTTARGIVNASAFCTTGGQVVVQEKCILTPYERHEMGLVAGDGLQLIECALGKFGVLICYDSEFPLLARALAEAGAEVLLVPGCTDFPAGQTRVRQSARARAIEQQCLVVQSPLIGRVAGCDVVDVQTGRAGVFGPPDHGLPSDGILAQGETDVPGWVICDVDVAAVLGPRQDGQVGNFAHWCEQRGGGLSVVRNRIVR